MSETRIAYNTQYYSYVSKWMLCNCYGWFKPPLEYCCSTKPWFCLSQGKKSQSNQTKWNASSIKIYLNSPFHSHHRTPWCEKHEQSGASVYLIAIKVFLNITVWILPFHYYKIGSISCMRYVCSGCNIFLVMWSDNYYFLFFKERKLLSSDAN